MSFFAILANLSSILGLIHTIQNLIGDVAKTKKPPTIQALIPLIDQVETVLKSGAFDIPNVDEKQVAEALDLIKNELKKFTDQTQVLEPAKV